MIVFIQGNDGKYQTPDNLLFVNLPHPKAGNDVVFVIVDGNIMELQSVQPRRHGSWFIDQRISSDNFLYLASKIDPRFLILPFLEKDPLRFRPLDQIVLSKIPLTGSQDWKLDEICDVNDKHGDDMIFFRINELKTLKWLKLKVEKTAVILSLQRARRIKNSNICSSSTFDISVQSQKSTSTKDTHTEQSANAITSTEPGRGIN